eukprot:c3463_g1_i2.p1 GENE.c3463_g1_i2~~c3463_g1_i2.p1  ORF type:complete len:157 (-),score=31.42 c3463_g1_i2:204-674(-)
MLSSGAVHPKAEVTGGAKLGEKCVLHPYSVITGNVVIGPENIFQEFCSVVNQSATAMAIGSHNIFSVRCSVSSCTIGSGNIFHAHSKLNPGCVVGDGCVIGIGVEVPPNTHIPDNTVLYQNAFHTRKVPQLKEQNIKACSEEVNYVVSRQLFAEQV